MVLNVGSLEDVPLLPGLFAIVLWLPYLKPTRPAALLPGAGVDESLRVRAASGQRPVAMVDWRVAHVTMYFIYLVRYPCHITRVLAKTRH